MQHCREEVATFVSLLRPFAQIGMVIGFITLQLSDSHTLRVAVGRSFTYEAPPSTTRFAPFTYEENPLARKPATLAISCG